MNRLLFTGMALAMLFGISSCKLWRRVTGRQKAPAGDSAMVSNTDTGYRFPTTSTVQSDSGQVSLPAPADSAGQALLQRWLPAWNAGRPYSTFSGRAKMNYESSEESQEFTASIRIERDKRIWISVTALLGIEFARVLITPDTVIILDRFHKEARVMSAGDAHRLLPVNADFSSLQSLIVGDVLSTGLMPGAAFDSAQRVTLMAYGRQGVHTVTFSAADSTILQQRLTTDSAAITSDYWGYGQVGDRLFSSLRALNMNSNGMSHRFLIEFTKAAFDEPVDMSFSIPDRYERK